MAHGQCGKLFALAVEEWIASDYEPVHPQLGQPSETELKSHPALACST